MVCIVQLCSGPNQMMSVKLFACVQGNAAAAVAAGILAISILFTSMGNICCAPFRHASGRLNPLITLKTRFTECNLTLTTANDTLTSPGYPKNYPDNSDCWFNLKTPSATDRIHLEFVEFALEHSAQCTFDYLEIFDGPTTSADVLGKFCITKPANGIESSSNQLLLHFRSDYLLNSKGFHIRFTPVISKEALMDVTLDKPIAFHNCPTVGGNSSGVVTSPGYPLRYLPNANCTAILQTGSSQRYVLSFDDMDIEYDDLCLFDYVEIRDGPNQDSPQMAQICGKTAARETFTTTGNYAFIQFISDGFVEFRGFKLVYQSIAELPDYTDEITDEEDADNDDDDDEDGDHHDDTETGINFAPPLIFAQPFNATVPKGQSQTIDCLINGSNSAIVWLKDHSFFTTDNEDEDNGIQLLSNNSLHIAYMSEDMEGIYTCVVLSEHGAYSMNFWIVMDAASVDDHNECGIDLFQKPKDTMVNEGENTFFTCFANAAAGVVNITWLKDGDVIRQSSNDSDRIQILVENVLLINRTTVNDSGVYTCHAQHLNGCSREVEAFLTVEQLTAVPDFDDKNMCGRPKLQSNIPRSGKVVAGRVTPKGSFPWQAMLWETWVGQFCGGSLINPRWVMTAAHCFTEFQQQFSRQLQPDQLSIKLGKHDRSRADSDEQTLSTDKIILHPRFNKLTYDNDIALVRMAHPALYTDTVLPVCLVDAKFTKEDFYEEESAGVMGSVTGWGTVTERGMPSAFLQEIRLPLVNFTTCANSTRYTVTKNMFCAGYTQSVMGDACHGDSGGPYTVLHQGQWYQLGIVSWGEGCDREGKYGFYTKVGNYVQWIISTIENEQY